MNCRFCGALASGGQYCIGCGEPLAPALSATHAAVGTRERARPAPGAWLTLQEIRLLACPKCGAPNSAARWRCARCGHRFDGADQDESTTTTDTSEQATAVQPESSRWLVLITAAAGVAVVAVAVTMLAARGIGPFRTQGETAAVAAAEPITIESVDGSSVGVDGATYENLVDGDPTTAWRVTGNGAGEWVELRFAEPVQIDHLLLWNGDQRDERSFESANRVKGLVVEFPGSDKVYKVEELPDRDTKVQVSMVRRPPVTDVVRLRITSIHNSPTGEVALSEIQALAQRAPAAE